MDSGRRRSEVRSAEVELRPSLSQCACREFVGANRASFTPASCTSQAVSLSKGSPRTVSATNRTPSIFPSSNPRTSLLH